MNPRARILIIDDGAETTPAWTQALDRAGYEVIKAPGDCGVSGLARQCNPDLLLLKMPLSEGIDACRNIKAGPETMDCMVALVTEREADTNAATDQADDVLFLPLTDRQLVSRIALLLRVKQTEDGQRSTSNRDAHPARTQSQAESASRERGRPIAQTETTPGEHTGLAHMASEQRLQVALQNSPVTVFCQDRELRYTWFYNARPGFCSERSLGQIYADLLSPGDARRLLEIQRVALQTGTESRQIVRIVQEGQPRFYDFSVVPVQDAHGSSAGVNSVAVDVTGRVRAEQRSRRKQAQILQYNRELVALNRIAIVMSQTYDLQDALFQVVDHLLQAMNFDCGIIQVFAEKDPLVKCAADRGFSESSREQHLAALNTFIRDSIEQTNRTILVYDQSEIPPAIAASLQAKGLRTGLSVRIHTPSRTLGAISLFSAYRTKLTESELHLLTAVAHQIGAAYENMHLLEQTAQIEMLTRLEALRAELIANVSHELRTPLGLIEIAASSLSSEDIAFDDATRSKFLQIIAQESQRLNVLVNNLLGLSRVENKQLIVNKQPVDLDPVILKTCDLMRIQSPERQIVYEPADLPAPIPADAYALEQILINLLSNAIKYSPPDTPITIRVRPEKEQVVVQIQDHGIGIPEAELKPVFGRFYRGKHERVRQAGGIGLGLAVCRELVRAHGGRIWAESQAGDGTTVSFTLPVQPAPPPAEG